MKNLKTLFAGASMLMLWGNVSQAQVGTCTVATTTANNAMNLGATYGFYFTGTAIPSSGQTVNVGYSCGTSGPGKFNTTEAVGSSVTSSTIGGYFLNRDFSTSTSGISFTGVKGESTNTTTTNSTNTGGEFFATGATNSMGVRGAAQVTASSQLSYGGKFFASSTASGATNYGTYTSVSSNSCTNYGLYTSSTGTSATNYGIYATASGGTLNYAGYFNGDIYGNGISTTAGNLIVSDERFKQDVKPVDNALSIINQLKPRSYNYINNNEYGMNFPKQKQYGFIAQDVQKLLPELVSATVKPEQKDEKGNVIGKGIDFIAVNYTEFIPLLVQGMQEQDKTIKSLQEEIGKLNAIIANTGNSSSSTATANSIDLKDGQSVILDQNVPNPFAEKTSISYFLPENVQKAQMLFYNSGGKLIQTMELTQKGKGQVTVFASDLSNGMYTYTLVADGKAVDSKRMIKQ
ncbi:MAG: tail fiber domain-containing protein [Bacteroidia bacterium]